MEKNQCNNQNCFEAFLGNLGLLLLGFVCYTSRCGKSQPLGLI